MARTHPKHVAADFKISKIVLIQSLEPAEPQTGRIVAEFIEGLDSFRVFGVQLELIECESARHFLELLGSLEAQARVQGAVPLLHVECHGHKEHGLEFANGSELSWQHLYEALVSLNRASHFNLLTVFSACFGAYFLDRMSTVEPAPCFALIAPSDTVRPHEIMSGFRIFYSTFFARQDAGIALSALLRQRLERGYWFGQRAEFWFHRVAIGYAREYCSRRATRRRVKRLYRSLLGRGERSSIGRLKREMGRTNRTNLLGSYFEKFFMIDAIPENRHRFAGARQRLEHALASLRASGRYFL